MKKQLLYILICTLSFACSTPSILVTQEQRAGDLEFNQNNYSVAADHYLKMIEASRKLGIYRNLKTEADVRRKTANCYEMLGRYDQAMMHIGEALLLDSLDNNLLGTIEDYRQMGKIHIYEGSYLKSIPALEKSLELSEGMDQSLKDQYRLAIADTYLALGQLYAVMGRFSSSTDLTNSALQLFNKTDDKKGVMEAYLTLGMIFSDIGDISSSETFLLRSASLADELKLGTSRQYQLLASLSLTTGKFEDAIRSQGKAIDEAEKSGILGQRIWANIGMGDIYSSLGDSKNAERFYNRARQLKENTDINAKSLEASLDLRLGDVLSARNYFTSEKSLTGGGITALRLAELKLHENSTDSALVYAKQAEASFVASGNRQGMMNAKLLRGMILAEKGINDPARSALDSASKATDFPETVWQAHFQTGRLFEKLNRDQDAIESYTRAVNTIEKIRGNFTVEEFKSIYFDSKRAVYDALIRILIRNNRVEDAFRYSEYARARAFYDMLANRKIDFGSTISKELSELEQSKRSEIQKLFKLIQSNPEISSGQSATRGSEIVKLRSSLTAAQEEYDEITRKIKLTSPAYAELIAVNPAELSVFQSRIGPGTAVLAYWLSENDSKLWLITNSGIQSRTIAPGSAGIKMKVESARKFISSNSPEDVSTSMKDLYKLLIYPFEKELAAITNLIIIPNGPLHFLPFQALINQKGEYLVTRYNIVYSPSASVFVVTSDRLVKTGSKFLGMALSDVSLDNNVGLPGTADELKRIIPFFPDNISAIGKQSSETLLKQKAGECNYLHFATHGIYNYDRPLYSHLLFPSSDTDDGRLNVYEVFEMSLNARLITLSACETGLGNLTLGDELTGLSRAFLFAGSSAVIVSLWSVADYPTAILMSNFYRFVKDHSLQEALTLAQREVIKLYPQPLYWSPFILIGNGNLTSD